MLSFENLSACIDTRVAVYLRGDDNEDDAIGIDKGKNHRD